MASPSPALALALVYMSWVHTALPKLPPVYYMYSHSVFQISTWMSCQHLRFCSSFSQLQTQFSVCIRKRNRFTRVAQQEIYLLIHVFSFSFRDEVKLKQALQWRHCFQQRRWQLLLVFCKAVLFQIVKTDCQENKKGWLCWALMFGRKRYPMLTINLLPPD